MSEYLVIFDVHEANRKWFEENYSALVEGFDRNARAHMRIRGFWRSLSMHAPRSRKKNVFCDFDRRRGLR